MKSFNVIFLFAVYARFEMVKAMDFLRAQLDTNFRKQWDTSATQLKIIEENKETNTDLVYWEMRWPVTFIKVLLSNVLLIKGFIIFYFRNHLQIVIMCSKGS
jgi:hypothetical protein